jgi:hypothetical protein
VSTDFIDDLQTDDIIESEHVNQFGAPINNLESGATWYGEASLGGSTDDEYTATVNSGASPAYPVTLTAGLMVHLKLPATANSKAVATLSVNGNTPKGIKQQNGGELEPGSMRASGMAVLLYDGTNFRLLSDDFSRYAALNGRPGGQTLTGDTASGGNLVLQSTSNATQGVISLLSPVSPSSVTLPSPSIYYDALNSVSWFRNVPTGGNFGWRVQGSNKLTVAGSLVNVLTTFRVTHTHSTIYAELKSDANGNLVLTSTNNRVLCGTGSTNGQLQTGISVTLTGGTTVDGYSGAIGMTPVYTGSSQTLTRHNYFDIQRPTLTSVTLTDACLFRFPAGAGTHEAVDGSSTKTSPGSVDAWVKINLNGTVAYIPAYFSKTS